MQQLRAIVGAGLAGLIAGYAFPGVPIFEANPRGATPHRAVLRFRTDAVSRLTGIPFRKVRVRKGIWYRGDYRAPNIQLANLYSRKCLDRVSGDRSIWSIESVDRWVGPETLIEEMTEALADRITFDSSWNFYAPPQEGFVISTAPLAVALAPLVEGPAGVPQLARAPIWVQRYRVPLADAHQTVYFPDHGLDVYRATLTGDLLALEFRAPPDSFASREVRAVAEAMALDCDNFKPLDSIEQRYGKIVPLPDDLRRHILSRLTIESGVYSLGRFATWRNILLDDVVNDIDVIRRMLRASSPNFAALRASAGADSAR